MFVFVGGVQPRTVTLGGRTRTCPSCGSHRAVVKRVDHHFSLFFIPLFPVKRGTPFLVCDACHAVLEEPGSAGEPGPGPSAAGVCHTCGRRVDPDFRFCPACGKPL